MVKYLKKLFSFISDILFPPKCPICGEPISDHGMLCGQCWGKFNWIGNPKCHVCGYPFPANIDLGDAPMCPVCASGNNELDWLRSACVYDDVSKNIMLPFKHAAALRYAPVMSRAMIATIRELPTSPDIVMPVPLAYRRLWFRGYNQATLLARPIAKSLGVKIDTASVTRKYRKDMGHLSSAAREKNIRGVFTVKNPAAVRGKTILLVDDVMTSGATFRELRRVLERAGANAVYGVTFCRVVRAI